jgi:hypothetical protein
MELICYHLIDTTSRRALLREKTKFGNKYHYRPRGDLLARLGRELGWEPDRVLQQLLDEREYLIRATRLI